MMNNRTRQLVEKWEAGLIPVSYLGSLRMTAFDLVGLAHGLIDNSHEIVVGDKGRVAYHFAALSRRSDHIRVERVKAVVGGRLRVLRRYLAPDQIVWLRPIS